MKKILCILPHIHDPTIIGRLGMLQEGGFRIEALAFAVRYFPGRIPNCPLALLGRLRFRAYFLRIFEILLRLPRIRAASRHSDIVYAFNLELGLAAMVACTGLGKPVVLEIHDIKRHQVAGGPKGWLVRRVDRFVTQACSLLVITTTGYYPYYRNWLKVKTPDLVIENKLDGAFAAAIQAKGIPGATGEPPAARPLRIGYFGVLVDEWSIRVLEALTASAPEKFQVVLAGTSNQIANLTLRAAQNAHMEYQGTYREPEDLENLYTGVDMVLACYAPTIPYCWSEATRFYKACLFRRPLIVRAGTGSAAAVDRYQIGLVVTDDDVGAAAAAIRGITRARWRRWRTNMAQVPREVYVYTHEADALGRALRETAGSAAPARETAG